jgi:hypothetical protein
MATGHAISSGRSPQTAQMTPFDQQQHTRFLWNAARAALPPVPALRAARARGGLCVSLPSWQRVNLFAKCVTGE